MSHFLWESNRRISHQTISDTRQPEAVCQMANTTPLRKPDTQAVFSRMGDLEKTRTDNDNVTQMLKLSLDEVRNRFSQLTCPLVPEAGVVFATFTSKVEIRDSVPQHIAAVCNFRLARHPLSASPAAPSCVS